MLVISRVLALLFFSSPAFSFVHPPHAARVAFLRRTYKTQLAAGPLPQQPPLPPPFGPRCLIIAGIPELHLETIDDIFQVTLGPEELPPVVILTDRDLRSGLTPRQLLGDQKTLAERDHALCGAPCTLPAAVVIFSGCRRDEVMQSIQAYRGWDAPTTGALRRAAFAVVVPPALDKPFKLLCEEICRDFEEEHAAVEAWRKE